MGKGPFINGQRVDKLGNYWKCEIKEAGLVYNSVEQYYQSRKCLKIREFNKMMSIQDPKKCVYYGRKITLIPGWEQIKYSVMKRAIHLKFEQHPELRKLISTDLYFCENGHTQDQWDIWNQEITQKEGLTD